MMPPNIYAGCSAMEFDIIIIGGGLVGASLAAALRDSGLSLALIESQHSPVLGEDWDSRIYAISPGCRRYLEDCGAWAHLNMSRVEPVEAMRVFGDDNAELEFSAYQMGVPELACILESRQLQHAIWQGLREQDNLTILQPQRCAALQVEPDAATLTLTDGRELRAKLVVGADGRDSWVRNQVGIRAAPVDYRQHGVVANFTVERAHRGIAYQWFQPDGILALLPLPDNRVSMVWSVSPEKSAQLLALSHEELCAQVAEAAHHTLGEMQVITPAAAFPLRLLVLPQISTARIALIGDAAHNMHPLAGQGVNTGFRDARELARTLLNRGAQTDCGDAQLLRRYDRKRKEDIYSMQATTYSLKHLFVNDDPVLKTLRNIGLNATNRLVPVKKLLMQHAFI